MKHLLTAALIATALASPVRAFDVDISRDELVRLMGDHTVSELSVGVTGAIPTNAACHMDGKLFIYNTVLNDNRKLSFFDAELQPNGEFALTFVNNDYTGQPTNTLYWSSSAFRGCDPNMIDRMGGIYPVATVDGFTSYSAWIESLISTYDLAE